MRRTIPVEVPWTSQFAPDTFSWQCTLDVIRMSRKCVKFKRKSKHKKKDKSKIVPTNDDQQATEEIKVQDEPLVLNSSTSVNKKFTKQAHIAFLTNKYQPLVEDDIDQQRDDNIKKKQDKYKKLRKVRD